MGPHNLPRRAVSFIKICVPVPLARDVAALNDDLKLRLITNRRSTAIDPNRDGFGFPVQIVDLTRADAAQILVLRQRAAQGVDQLEIVGVQLGRSFNIARDQHTQALTLRRPKEFHLPLLGRALV